MMKETMKEVTLEQFKDIIDIVNPCMDDYLYILDLQQDLFSISQSATERFRLPSAQFSEATDQFRHFVHPEDIALLNNDLIQLIHHGKKFHNIQYRWLGKDGRAIWINCRGRVLQDEKGAAKFLVGCINEIGMRQKADNISGLLREASLQNEMDISNKDAVRGFLIRL